jgi:hypothetical protein
MLTTEHHAPLPPFSSRHAALLLLDDIDDEGAHAVQLHDRLPFDPAKVRHAGRRDEVITGLICLRGFLVRPFAHAEIERARDNGDMFIHRMPMWGEHIAIRELQAQGI